MRNPLILCPQPLLRDMSLDLLQHDALLNYNTSLAYRLEGQTLSDHLLRQTLPRHTSFQLLRFYLQLLQNHLSSLYRNAPLFLFFLLLHSSLLSHCAPLFQVDPRVQQIRLSLSGLIFLLFPLFLLARSSLRAPNALHAHRALLARLFPRVLPFLHACLFQTAPYVQHAPLFLRGRRARRVLLAQRLQIPPQVCISLAWPFDLLFHRRNQLCQLRPSLKHLQLFFHVLIDPSYLLPHAAHHLHIAASATFRLHLFFALGDSCVTDER